MPNDPPLLPTHIQNTLQSITRLHAEHYRQAAPWQRVVNRATSAIGRPGSVLVLVAAAALWCACNGLTAWAGHTPLDAPPFFWLQGVIGLGGLVVAIMILASNRHADELATYREQLALELAILSDQKAAKIIHLLEEMRRDDPSLRDRHDADAAELSVPANPGHMLRAIQDAHGEIAKDEKLEGG